MKLARPPSPAASHTDAARRMILLLAILVIAATLLRLHGLAERSLWLDEAFSDLYARLDWGEVIELRRTGTNPPLYHFLLSGWVGLFGNSEFSLRFPSCVLGAAAVGLLFGLSRRLVDTRAALVAAGLLGISGIAVVHSQEARYYSLVEVLSIAATWALHAWVVDRKGRCLAVYVLLMVTFVWTHTFAWFVLLAHGLWWVRQMVRGKIEPAERRRLLRGGAVGFAVVIVAFLPWVPVLLDQIRTVTDDGYWIERPSPAMLAVCLYAFVAPVSALWWVVTAIAGGAIVYALIRRGRDRANVGPQAASHPVPLFLLAAWATIPILVPLGWSFVGTPIFQVKYAIVAQPAALILFGWLATRWTVPAMLVLIATSLIATEVGNYPRVEEQWRSAASIVSREAAADAPVYIYREYCCFALTYYFPEPGRVTPVYPDGQRRIDFAERYPNRAIRVSDLLRRLDESETEAWLVVARVRQSSDNSEFDALLERIRALRPIIQCWELQAVDVVHIGTGGSNAATRPVDGETNP